MPALPSPERLAADIRALRLVWLGFSASVAVLLAAVVVLVVTGRGGGGLEGDGLFYANALANALAVLVAFAAQRRLMEGQLPRARTYAEATSAIRQAGILSLGALDASVLFAEAAAYVTGDLFNLAFAVPYFAFAWLTLPNRDRLLRLLALAPLEADR